MSHALLLSLLVLAPLVGFIVNGFRYRQHSADLAGWIASGAAIISFICGLVLLGELISLPESSRRITVTWFEWIALADFRTSFAFLIDPVSIVMVLIITGVGSLIHIFSIGYMHHDKGAARYFAYLNFFLFNMLLLVLGDNLLVMFVGWEGVGLASYLLIGFWFKDSAKAAAGMKAFIVNRIGDAAFLLGIFVLFTSFGTVSFSELNELAPSLSSSSWMSSVTIGTLLLFIGATGKSAQIPLYVWLPDAMAGPTPVSALIHAATMVTAGVYMIVRLNPLFLAAPNTLMIIAVIGGLTVLLAAAIGVTQWDIKKVLAYSTVSQLGYMFLACGVGAFGAAMFHLMTHAFFKALMFLGSGSVIHAMNEEQDIRKMGALRTLLPITYFTFLIGWLAIIGIPPFAGFFSKDEILWLSFHSPFGHWAFWLVGVMGAALTAFYMTRLMALTFWGKSRVSPQVHPHESPWIMTAPLIVLGILSALGGWLGVPHLIGKVLGGIPNILEHWFSPVIGAIPGLQPADYTLEAILMGASLLVVIGSSSLAYFMYIKNPELPAIVANKVRRLYELVSNKFYVDEAYAAFIVNPIVNLGKGLWVYVDVNFVDRTTYVLSDLMKSAGGFVRRTQNGNVQQYAMYIVLGVVLALSLVLTR